MKTKDNYQVGDVVIARFTNSGNCKEFTGQIIERLKRQWKVKSLEAVWPGEPAGRVFHIEALESRRYSNNNCIAGRPPNPARWRKW